MDIQRAMSLLVWWYIEVNSNEETAQEQCSSYNIDPEGEPFNILIWPLTRADEWCGEFKAKSAKK
jgi:hypothetical protein